MTSTGAACGEKYSINKMPLPLSLDTEEGAMIIESFN